MFLLLFVVLALRVDALPVRIDCKIHPHDESVEGMQLLGYVSLDGHYSSVRDSGFALFPYGLFCSDYLVSTRTDGEPTFYFSDPGTMYEVQEPGISVRGSGHVSLVNEHEFEWSEALHGFARGQCEVKQTSEGCDDNQVCVIKISGETNGHIADCNQANLPHENNYQKIICCTPTEYCRDGVDNTGDGLIDCQSPDCHPTKRFDVNTGTTITTPPQQCDPGSYIPGNNQSTPECVIDHEIDANGIITPIFSPHCMGPDPSFPGAELPYYCNYGFDDDPLTHNDGFCCPEEQYYNSESGDCEDFQVCGIQPSQWCGFSFPINTNSWLSQLFDGVGDKWCHSHLPHLTNIQGVTRSEACCPVMTHGTFGYFVVDENVKIFGYE